jgi:uncharacterized protein (DUF2344 family)
VYYSKDYAARFIGHLDLQSLFSKALKRAALPVAYSQGFNPMQLLSIALPLPLGMAGKCEILELYLTHEVDINDMAKNLNSQMPHGLEILEIREIPAIGKSAAATVYAAKYLITFPCEITPIDGLDGVINIKIIDTNSIEATLAAGSKKNLKPQVFAKQMLDSAGAKLEPDTIKYERIGLLL